MFDTLRSRTQRLRVWIADYSCAHMIRLIGLMPSIGGFPLMSEKIFVPFWVIHLLLTIYVYFVGVTFYQMYESVGFISAVSSFFNILVMVLVVNNSIWFLLKRKEINNLLVLVLKNDTLVMKEGRFLNVYKKLMRNTKKIILTCYAFHFINDVLVFIPKRIFDMASFSIASCVGLHPLSVFPNREICMAVLAGQELTSILVVSGYDVIILFLYSHTTATFFILCKDIESLSEMAKNYDGSAEMRNAVDDRLRNLIGRHSLVLLTVKKLQKLLSVTIGVVIVLNVVSVCIFFVMPLEVTLSFAPLIAYTLTIFFLYCVLGQRLINASVGFEMEVYCCGWENMELKHQRVIFLMLKQAQKPVSLHAVGMVPIYMATFASTMQAIYRFITVFRV